MSRRTDQTRTDPHAGELCDRADDAFERGEPQTALALADEALQREPGAPVALHYRAAALGALGKLDEAEEAYRRALEAAPDDLFILRGAAELLVLDRGEDRDALEDALALCKRALRLTKKREERELAVDFHLIAGIAFNQLGESNRALAALEEAKAAAPDDPEVGLERAIALFELCRLGESKRELERVLALDARDGWAHHYLGLIAERKGDAAQARKHAQEARKRSPTDFPAPVELSAQAFDRAIQDALERLPERVRRYLDNVSIVVQELPRDEDLTANDPPLSPLILGLFHGTPITEKSSSDPWSYFPSSIVLYQRNLERFAHTREELIEQIGITLMHEVGHFLGLSEDDLYQRGLE